MHVKIEEMTELHVKLHEKRELLERIVYVK
jgi:hypothetical protein